MSRRALALPSAARREAAAALFARLRALPVDEAVDALALALTAVEMDTYGACRALAVEHAKLCWKVGAPERSDAITDFVDELDQRFR